MELPGDVGDEIFILCKTFKQLINVVSLYSLYNSTGLYELSGSKYLRIIRQCPTKIRMATLYRCNCCNLIPRKIDKPIMDHDYQSDSGSVVMRTECFSSQKMRRKKEVMFSIKAITSEVIRCIV